MKCFIFSVIGLLASAILMIIISSQYGDYRSVVETDRWLVELKPLQSEIELNALKVNSLEAVGKSINKPEFSDKNVTLFVVLDSGIIIVKGGREGQLLVLAPSLVNNTIQWNCMVGSENAMPLRCKRYGWHISK